MTKEELFAAGLEKLRSFCAGREEVKVQDILAAFGGLELDRGQVEAVYAYLEEQGVKVADYVPHDTQSMTVNEMSGFTSDAPEDYMDEEEKKVYEMYLEDLAGIAPLGAKEEEALLKVLKTGTAEEARQARSRLTEGNLRWVLQLAGKYAGCGVTVSDLIQEGNMALLLGLDSLPEDEEAGAYLERSIQEAMRELIKEQNGYDRAGERMAEEANRILELTRSLEEEREGTVSPEEIAEKLKMPVSRVREVMLESAKAMLNIQK